MPLNPLSFAAALIRRWRRLKVSGLFDSRFYVGQAGVGRWGKLFPLMHYLACGEDRGLKPNLWFDPVFYRRHVGGNWTGQSALNHYAVVGGSQMLPPSALVDPQWHYFQNPDARKASSVLHHLLTRAMPEGRDPSPLIDLVSVQRLAVERNEPLNAVLEQVVNGHLRCNACYRDLEELQAAQQHFLASLTVRTLKALGGPPRRNLLFVQAGRRLAGLQPPATRDWDLCLNWYDDGWQQYSGGADMQFQQGGTKFTAIAKLRGIYPGFFGRYERIWFLDDDIAVDLEAIDPIFRAAKTHGLDLAQPSLSADSFCVWRVFLHRPEGPVVRYTNGVEIMMPIVASRLLNSAGPQMAETVSGFGLDFLWAKLAGGGKDQNIAILNDFQLRHPVPIDPSGGAFYEYLRGNNINPKAELFRILRKYETETMFREIQA